MFLAFATRLYRCRRRLICHGGDETSLLTIIYDETPVMDEQDAPIQRRRWWHIGEAITSLFQPRAGYYSGGEINAEDPFDYSNLRVLSGRLPYYEPIVVEVVRTNELTPFLPSFLPSSRSYVPPYLPTRSALKRPR